MRDLVVFLTQSDGQGHIIKIDVEDSLSLNEIVDHGTETYSKDDEFFEPYKNRINRYVKEHINDGVIYKLHNNVKLSEDDIRELQNIVWNELGTKTEYQSDYKDMDVGIMMRQIVGLDMNADKEAFSKFIQENDLNAEQIEFINLTINYIVENGLVAENNILLEAPFDTYSTGNIFENEDFISGYLHVIEGIRSNAIAGFA